jgi:hypothetical protein
MVSDEWSWFGDHVAVSVTYLVVGQAGRTYETGTGVFFRSRPWGSVTSRSGTAKFSAWGAGTLHIRQVDSGPPFKVCSTVKDLDPITIIQAEF